MVDLLGHSFIALAFRSGKGELFHHLRPGPAWHGGAEDPTVRQDRAVCRALRVRRAPESYGQMTEGWDPVFRVLPKSKHEVPHSFTLFEAGRLALRVPRKSTN